MTGSTMVQQNRQRSNSYDSAYYYNNNNHITFVTNNNRQVDLIHYHRKYSNSLHPNDDNITLVADEDDANSYKVIASSISSYVTDTYTKYSPSIVLENKGNTARDHLGNTHTHKHERSPFHIKINNSQ
jgi:hypothetical protein